MSRKKLVDLVFVLMALLMFTAAGSGPLVSITAGQPEYTAAGFQVSVEVQFSDTSLYNDDVALSAHLYSDDGDLLVWETMRYSLELDASGHASQMVAINLSDYAELVDIDKGVLQFDLVDQKNSFWFSDKSDVFSGFQIEWDKSNVSIDPSQKNTIADKTVSRWKLFVAVVICLMGWLVVLTAFGYWRYCKHRKETKIR